MATQNKHTEQYDITEVNSIVMTNFKHAVMVVSLFANLTIFVTWLVVAVS